MNTIKRDVYVLKNTIKIPIEVTKGTDAITFEFTVRDYNLPATAEELPEEAAQKLHDSEGEL